MPPCDAGQPARVRPLHRGEIPAACRLASSVFRENKFYQDVLGLDPESFDAYWESFLPLALSDPGGRVFALECAGELTGLLIVAWSHFPAWRPGLRFLWTLLRRVGVRRFICYLRFLGAYSAVMRRPRGEEDREARGLWLLTAQGRGRVGLGARLLRAAMEASAVEGKTLFTGFCDGADERLVHFYKRAGFAVSEPFPFAHGRAAIIELRTVGSGAPVDMSQCRRTGRTIPHRRERTASGC